jgi:hypothetical protein
MSVDWPLMHNAYHFNKYNYLVNVNLCKVEQGKQLEVESLWKINANIFLQVGKLKLVSTCLTSFKFEVEWINIPIIIMEIDSIFF